VTRPASATLSLMTDGPTPGELLLMFEAVAFEYEAFDAMLPEIKEFNIGGSRDQAAHMGNQIRAMLLRKFITKKDSVYLPKVYDPIVTCSSPGFVEVSKKIAATRKSDFANAGKSMSAFVVGVGEQQTSHGEQDIYYDLTYGRLLHADFDRWCRLEKMPDLYPEWALWEAHSPFDFFVKEARLTVTDGRANGSLVVPERTRARQFPTD